MLNFILAIIIYIAHFFPKRKIKPVGQLEEKHGSANLNVHGYAKGAFKFPLSKPTRNGTTTVQVSSSSQGISESSKASVFRGMFFEKSLLDVSAHVQEFTAACENAFYGVALEGGTPPEATLVATPSESLSASVPQQEYGEEEHQDEVELPKMTPFNMETMALVNAALNQIGYQETYRNSAATGGLESKEQEKSRGMEPTPEVQNSSDIVSFECNVQNGVENTAAVEERTTEQDNLLKAEEALHRETREQFSRLSDWCNHLDDENRGLQIQVEDGKRQNGRMQRQLQDAEDESTTLQTRLSGAEGQIQQLTNAIMHYLSMIEGLQAQVAGLNAKISSYTRLGTSFYLRLQNAEKFLNPEDVLHTAYKLLMSDVAQCFSTPASAGDQGRRNGYVYDDAKVEELDEIDENEEDGSSHYSDQEEDQAIDGEFKVGKSKVTCDHKAASEVDAIHAEEDIAPLDDDDITFPNRPMRPGTANRIPISVFTARSGHPARNPSFSVSEDSSQQSRRAPKEAAPAFGIDFNFSKSSVKSEEKSGTTAATEPVQEPAKPVKESEYNAKASNTSFHGKGGIERGWTRSGRGTTRAKMPLRASRGTRSGNDRKGTNAGAISSPASASPAFPIDYGFAEHLANTHTKHDATTHGKSENLAVYLNPSLAQPKTFGTASEVEQTQAPVQEGQTATPGDFNPDSSAVSLTSPNKCSSSGSSSQPYVPSPPTPATELL